MANPLPTFLIAFHGTNDYATQGTDADAAVNKSIGSCPMRDRIKKKRIYECICKSKK